MFKSFRAERGAIPTGWIILLAGIASFLFVTLFRTWTSSRQSGLEALIASNAPTDHVHGIAFSNNGTRYVGTHLGLLRGEKGENWSRVGAVSQDIRTVLGGAGNAVLVVGDGLGLSQLKDNRLEAIAGGEIATAAADPRNEARLLIYRPQTGLEMSEDGGKSWTRSARFDQTEVLSVALDQQRLDLIAVGGLNGFFAISDDGGKSFTQPGGLAGSVSALAFDPFQPGRLWACAGGNIYTSDSQGATWMRVPLTSDQSGVISVAFPGEGASPVGVTPEGLIVKIRN